MSLLDDIATYFMSHNLASAGTIFYDGTPDDPDECIAVYEYAGNAFIPQIAGVLRSVQVVVRSKSQTKARSLANLLYRSLQTDDGVLYLTEDRWCVMSLRQPPFKLKVDTHARYYFCFNAGITTYQD